MTPLPTTVHRSKSWANHTPQALLQFQQGPQDTTTPGSCQLHTYTCTHSTALHTAKAGPAPRSCLPHSPTGWLAAGHRSSDPSSRCRLLPGGPS